LQKTLYLTVIMDWFSRKVRSWDLSNTLDQLLPKNWTKTQGDTMAPAEAKTIGLIT